MNKYRLHDTQQLVAKDTTRFRVVNCGRGWGKTHMAIEEILGVAVAKSDRVCIYIAPTNQQTKDIAWERLKERVQPIMVDKREAPYPEVQIKTVTGGKSWIKLRSWESVESLRGQEFDFIVIDEVASMRNFAVGWGEVLRPTLRISLGGVLFVSTPKGFNHWHDLYTQDHKSFKSFTFTSYDNPFLSREEIDSAKEEIGEAAFGQEYLADFTKNVGFTSEQELVDLSNSTTAGKELIDWLELNGDNYIDQCEIIKNYLEGIEKNYPRSNFYIGIDVAKVNDSTVVTVLKDKTSGTGKITCISIDSTGAGDFMPDWFERNSRWYLQRVKFSLQTKDVMAKNLKAVITKRKTQIPKLYKENSVQFYDDQVKRFITEMLQLQTEQKGNYLSVKHPEGNYHDDYYDSWCLAEHAYTTINGLPRDEIKKPEIARLSDRVQEMLRTRANQDIKSRQTKPFTYE